MTFDEVGEQADRVRNIPLESVLRLAGAQPDRRDRRKWHTPDGRILSITGMKFMDWTAGRGGGGAIDLVMHLHRTAFKPALLWLCRHFPVAAPSRPARETNPSTPAPCCPIPDHRKLPRVTRYLIRERGLPSELIERLIEARQLYADSRDNAVFPLLGKKKQVVGAELRGTTSMPWRGMARGSRKDEGYFAITPPHPQRITLCESAIDALSCHVLYPSSLCISTAGARANPRWLPDLFAQGLEILCGFDADPTGDHMASSMIKLHPAVKRLRPTRNDWNDVLRSS